MSAPYYKSWIKRMQKKKKIDISDIALFTGVQHICTFNIVALLFITFAKCMEGVVHHQQAHLC